MDEQIFNQLIEFGELNQEDSTYNLPFSVLRSSQVFVGHFPNQPILPGVAMIELVQRATELVLNEKLELKSAGNFKFLMMIDPDKVPNANLIFGIIPKEDGWRVKAQIKHNENIYFKADAFYVTN
jgi:3-hydroxyacyl-[acyl-carrier-protein] dehydratase